jgi:large subunit ribosomal protein L29
MTQPDMSEMRKLSDGDISDQINGIRRELFDLRFQQATRQLQKPHRFKEARRRLAQLLTVRQQRLQSTNTP